jgi:hypothetical protein
MLRETRALEWIIKLLAELEVPLQAVGGLAARTYGAKRPLVDFDFYVPTDALEKVAVAAGDRVVCTPRHHKGDCWDITFMILEFEGQRIELGGADGARYFDRLRGVWENAAIDFDQSVPRRVFGIEIPVIPFERLVEYKRRLDRDVDRRDLAEIEPW